MLPVIAIVGRPNVGKSTLFNRLTKTRDALVANISGLTRDRHYGRGRLGEKAYLVVDTGGIGEEDSAFDELSTDQSNQAIEEADYILFIVDGRTGLTAADLNIAKQLRLQSKQVYLAVNKTDGLAPDTACADFFQLGITEVHPIAAVHGRGVASLISKILENVDDNQIESDDIESQGIKIAIVGRPNVGKSTLVNRLLGEERMLVSDIAGTTRDSVLIPFERDGRTYTLIDTAGLRRKAKVNNIVEKFSAIKTLQSIESAHVCIVLLNARDNVTEQDLRVLHYVLSAGRALVICVNQWDGLTDEARKNIKSELDRRLGFTRFARTHFISALHGTGVGHLMSFVQEAYQSAMRQLSTPELTRILEKAVMEHQPPLVSGRRIKLKYAHAGGKNPPIIVVHGTQVPRLPKTYQRYLLNTYREKLKIIGTPMRLELKSGQNPYADKQK